MRTAQPYWAVIIAALLLVACDRRPDTEGNVRKALDQANITSVDVHVDGEANIVHLTGTVETLADRTRAEEIAAATIGTTGQVVNELTVEVLDDPDADNPDQQLTKALDLLIDHDPVLKERDINFHVTGGTVSITGEVRTAAEKDRVARMANNAPGVKDVTNQLQINRDH